MDEFTRKRYDAAAERYISVLLVQGLLEASHGLRHTTLDVSELNRIIQEKLHERGYRIKGERNESTDTDRVV